MYIIFILEQENHCEVITVDLKDWEFFTKAKCLEFDYWHLAFTTNRLNKYTNSGAGLGSRIYRGSHSLSSYTRAIDTKTFNIVCIESPNKKERKLYLLREKEPYTQSVLLLEGSIETYDIDCSELVNIFNGQIEADEKAFKQGLIRYPIYELLSTVSKLIKHRNKKYSVIFEGKRNLSYKNSGSADNTIRVNLERGCFRLNDSDTEYTAYMPAVNDENLLDLRKKTCYTFADSLNIRLAKLLQLNVIDKSMDNREVTIYIDRDYVSTILIGQGEGERQRKIINYVNGQHDVKDEDRVSAT